MKVEIYYLNDEAHDVVVRVLDSLYNVTTATGDMFVTLKPAEGRLFELHIPVDSILFVKKWSKLVLLSYTYLSAHVQPVVDPQNR